MSSGVMEYQTLASVAAGAATAGPDPTRVSPTANPGPAVWRAHAI